MKGKKVFRKYAFIMLALLLCACSKEEESEPIVQNDIANENVVEETDIDNIGIMLYNKLTRKLKTEKMYVKVRKCFF